MFWCSRLLRKAQASWLLDDAMPHSLTYTPDAARGVAMLAAKEFGLAPKYRLLYRPMLRIAGWFDPIVRESYEMLYQSDSPYLFDSTKFATEFGFAGTAYAEGIGIAAASYKRKT